MRTLTILFAITITFTGCTKEIKKLNDEEIKAIMEKVTAIELPSMEPDEVAVLETTLGTLVLEFDLENAPNHSKNFKKLVESGYYTGTTFHRVMSGFVIQGGDINSRDTIPENDGEGGPGYRLDAEIHNRHVRGTLAAARMGNMVNPTRQSSGSQFYICHEALPQLDGEYTAYGKLIVGYDVLDKIAAVKTGKNNRPVEDVVITNAYMARAADYN